MVLDNHLYRNMNVNMVEFREIGSLVLESRQVKYILTYTAEQVFIFQVIAVRLLKVTEITLNQHFGAL